MAKYDKTRSVQVPRGNVSATVLALPKENAVGLQVIVKAPTLRELLDAHKDDVAFLIRFRTAEGFRTFMLDAVDAACEIWPEVRKDFEDANE